MFVLIKSTSGKWFPTAEPQEDWFRLQFPEKNKQNGHWRANASDLVTAIRLKFLVLIKSETRGAVANVRASCSDHPWLVPWCRLSVEMSVLYLILSKQIFKYSS
jgi:hypothetical protein